MKLIIGIIIFNICNGIHTKTLANSEEGSQANYQIKDVDFMNTKNYQICLIANIECDAILTERSTNYTFKMSLPTNASTKGSFCNFNFVSLLQLNFGGAEMRIKFTKTALPDEHTYFHTQLYCEDCDDGEWKLSSLDFFVQNVTEFTRRTDFKSNSIYTTASWQSLVEASPELTTYGISIRRAFKCENADKLLPITMDVTKLKDKNGNDVSDAENWEVEIRFKKILVQPFLAKSGIFNYPFKCGNLRIFHILVIVLPLLFFVILVVTYKINDRFRGKKKHNGEKEGQQIKVPQKVLLNVQEKKLLTNDFKH